MAVSERRSICLQQAVVAYLKSSSLSITSSMSNSRFKSLTLSNFETMTNVNSTNSMQLRCQKVKDFILRAFINCWFDSFECNKCFVVDQ